MTTQTLVILFSPISLTAGFTSGLLIVRRIGRMISKKKEMKIRASVSPMEMAAHRRF
jgi:uncharacterized protein YneF (UPF0154 family)